MVVTIMEKITSLVKKLKSRASQEPYLHGLTFTEGETFSWDYTANAITYQPRADDIAAYLLHEFSHALLRHNTYASDIDLIKMERAAWDSALLIAKDYTVTIDDNLVENALDTYRDWIHSRSLCPTCTATGIQSAKGQYTCVSCHTTWRVNEARTCALRRHQTKKRS